MTTNPLSEDLDHILAHTNGLWEELRGKRIFITGGTGFFGCWLLESFAWANDKLMLNAEAVVLTRNPDTIKQKAPHLAQHPAITFHVGDVRNFKFPAGSFSHVIHAAAEADTTKNKADPLGTLDTIIHGTRRVAAFASEAKIIKLLLVSSGAVYGPQPSGISTIEENYRGAPDPLDTASAYGEGKRTAELIATTSSKQGGWEVKIARGFTFAGPYLPLNGSFAIGNFVRDALHGGPIIVTGDGTTCRSYLYGSDLAIWLWTILFKGPNGQAYNVGSEKSISMANLAKAVSQGVGDRCPLKITQAAVFGKPITRYIPDTRRARMELGLSQHITLDESVKKMIRYWSTFR